MKCTIILILILLVSLNCFSNELESEISNYQMSDHIYISKARQMLMDEIIIRDSEKIKEIVNHLLEKYEYSNSIPLTPWEKFTIIRSHTPNMYS